MAPGQMPHQPAPWRGTHPLFLLSPLMGLLSRAWSLLRAPGPPEPWLVEAVTEADQGGAGLEDEAKASLATYHALWGRHPQEETKDSGAAEEDREASPGACPNLEAKHSLPEAWGLSDDDDEKYGGEEATGVPREQKEFMDGQPAPLPLSLLIRSLPDLPGEEESKEEAVTGGGGNEVTAFSFPLSHWECCPGEEEEEEEENGEAVRVCRPVNGATEERTQTEAATKTSMSPSSVGSHLRAWECCSGKESEEEEKDKQAEKGDADPGPHFTSLAQRPSLRTWQHPSSAITEEEEDRDSEEMGASSSVPLTSAFLSDWVYQPEDTEEEDEEEEDCDSEATEDEGEAEVSSATPPPSAFLSAWVYRPGEDTEEEEDCDSEATEDEGEAEVSSATPPTSAFLSAWVYQPGDTEEEEDCDSEATEDEGEAEVSSATPPPSAFLSAWVYRPGEDTEEEDEYEDEDNESGAADLGPSPSLQTQSALLRDQIYQPGEKTDGGEAAEKWGEAESCPFRVAIYLPGEKPPPPWDPPRLPLRLQRRLKSAQTPTRHQDLERLLKTRKVRFSEKVSIHPLVVWAGPAQAARRGPWEQFARDRSRFARRIAQVQEELGPYLTPAARARAWARLGNPPTSLATVPAPTQTSPMTPIQATPLSHALASPSPPCVSPSLDLSGRRG
ncbi:protein phosphatase 1 regulatory subunit 15A isoform X1 [Bos indicus x Bos taurus]|uniref:Protein phosphatase 1 regulatory subunit 15A n=2 Tax=Bos TaxID=9903 RepID=PR15A_BOVIN|nr:protein phosphatase 1 regulatory subunit 15A precursor [Bos taurus]XP_027370993.1 protein phosphatase 1 regulatory subunit 15A isoform X1 [Bos indicus x Bos taurus]Q2KI51.2 RecName: Full=Protein phosphatase 1 regulatory subunit 15A; AltName: Full=Growth arrest and DNA damage-inducible protein GADD34 [Bos taurus]AAI12769.2 PPP1R15A protein [Bos taurus]